MIFVLTTIEPTKLSDAINNTDFDHPDHLLVKDLLHYCNKKQSTTEMFATDEHTGEFIGAYRHDILTGTCDIGKTKLLEEAKSAARKLGRTMLTVFATSGKTPINELNITKHTCCLPV